jgi:predicted HAD superfamily phosphohydrolase YqeG
MKKTLNENLNGLKNKIETIKTIKIDSYIYNIPEISNGNLILKKNIDKLCQMHLVLDLDNTLIDTIELDKGVEDDNLKNDLINRLLQSNISSNSSSFPHVVNFMWLAASRMNLLQGAMYRSTIS